MRSVAENILDLACVKDGLDSSFSPNHSSGMTTRLHTERQLQMVALLEEGDFSRLARAVRNPRGGSATAWNLERIFAPLLPSVDWRLLALLAGFHDLGKVRRQWANEHLDVGGVGWVAHDHDTKILLERNPELLSGFGLAAEERERLLELCRLHSIPGQFFFGEGNLAAYQWLADDWPQGIIVARVHGLVDAMSALNDRFTKSILDTHMRLGSLLERAKGSGDSLSETLRAEAKRSYMEETGGRAPVGPVTWRRLRLLLGDGMPGEDVLAALDSIPDSLLERFDQATDGDHTWYGTYVANAFGRGLLRAHPDEADRVFALLVKVVAGCSMLMDHKMEWCLGAVEPALVVGGPGRSDRILDSLNAAVTPEHALEILTSGSTLKLRVAEYGVAVELQ